MSEQVNKEQTKGAEQENITELTDEQLDEAAGGGTAEHQLIGPGDQSDGLTHAKIRDFAVNGSKLA